MLEELETSAQDQRAALESLAINARERAKKLSRLETDITRKEVTLEEMEQSLQEDGVITQNGQVQIEPSGRLAKVVAGIEEKVNAVKDIVLKIGEIHDQLRDAKSEEYQVLRRKNQLTDQLSKLDDSRNRKLQSLNNQYNQDTYKAIMWLSENRSRFREKVFEPILLEINVTDKK